MPVHSHKKKCSKKSRRLSKKCYKMSRSAGKCKKGSRRHRKNSRKCCKKIASPCGRCPAGYHRSKLTGACETYVKFMQAREGQISQIQEKKDQMIMLNIQTDERKEILEERRDAVEHKIEQIESIIDEIKDTPEQGSRTLVLLEKQLSLLETQDEAVSEEIKKLEELKQKQMSQIESLQYQERKLDEEMMDEETKETVRIIYEDFKREDDQLAAQLQHAREIKDEAGKRQTEKYISEKRTDLVKERDMQIQEVRDKRREEKKLMEEEVKQILEDLNKIKEMDFYEIARREGMEIEGPPYSIAAVQKVFRKLSLIHHPDKCSSLKKEYCAEYFKTINDKKRKAIATIMKQTKMK